MTDTATRYEYLNTGDDAQAAFHSTRWLAQTFIPSVTHLLTGVWLKMSRNGSPGTITVGLRATSGAVPTGADLDSGTYTGNSLPLYPAFRWVWIPMSNANQTLTASTRYAIVIRSAAVWAYVRFRSTGGYANGVLCSSSNSGVTWMQNTAYDMMFEEWGATTVPDMPAVTTFSCVNVLETSAGGRGSLDSLGGSSVTQHGHCWSTSANPTTSDSKTTLDAKSAAGEFYSAIIGLTTSTLYHTRAYATNTQGTSYGADVTFTTGANIRATNLVHRFNRLTGEYTLEINIGDVTSDFGLPEPDWRPLNATVTGQAESDAQRLKDAVKGFETVEDFFREDLLRGQLIGPPIPPDVSFRGKALDVLAQLEEQKRKAEDIRRRGMEVIRQLESQADKTPIIMTTPKPQYPIMTTPTPKRAKRWWEVWK